ncbi:single-stranded DNA-binding protein [Frigoribacterium sp. ACAM 257]|uniref:single-stranded DNA-binding protein n=1 Tax=Frigoribacterium sp. ACAM 257 TaxID=2508998 RepID=UPI0011BA26D7|nr:single-stranded DNA-binding protein [Frigoribacterium sp. ACAM 257]TWX37269.1 single-stranded DNA-binding protein [Frigoribacterium sp. ACAM 257]
MTDTITLTGIIATDPRVVTTEAGLDIASFRLASTHRRFDRVKDEWVDGDTNWYTVTAFRVLGANAGLSLHKGERVVVLGRLRIRAWEAGDKSGTTVEVDADAIGHDLRWGRSTFTRSTSAAAAPTGTSEATGGGAVGDSATAPGDEAAVSPPALSAGGWAGDGSPALDERGPTPPGAAGDPVSADPVAPADPAVRVGDPPF